MDNIASINMLLQMIDANDDGYIDKEKLRRLCPHLSQIEIDTIFRDLDEDHDNRICLKELFQSNAYPEELKQQNSLDYPLNTKEVMTQTQIQEVFNKLSCQEQIYEFYEALRNGPSHATEQFQSILEVFVADILKYQKEIKRLEDSFKREKETNEKYLRTIEEDQERDMRQLEEKTRQEERQKFDIERESILERTSNEIHDLKLNLSRLRTLEKIYTDRKNEDDSSNILLHNEIAKLKQENQTLNASLNDSLTTIAILKSDLQSTKSQLNERQTMLLQEKQSSSSNYRERESLQNNIRHLVEVNKQLRDENDLLRANLETYKANPLINSTTLQTSVQLKTSTENASLAAQCTSIDLGSADEIDSGLSLMTIRDATELETDLEPKLKRQVSIRNSKHLRSHTSKCKDDDTDSDDDFVQIELKRTSQRRSLKRGSSNGRLSKQSSIAVPSPSIGPIDETKSSDGQANLPFDRMFKIVFCGDAAVGKSTLIVRLCKQKFVTNVNSTLGVDFQNKQIEIDNKRIALQLWDTAGQERFRSIAKSYFRRCDGVILVYDSIYERSFLNVREWIHTIHESTPKRVSVMIVANKIDLRDQLRAEGRRVIEQHEGAKLAKEYHALFIEASAKDGTNTNETLIELARDMQCNEDLERFNTVGIDLDKNSTKKTTCCGS